MQVNAEIHLGKRSVLKYHLSLVQKVAYEAGRERWICVLCKKRRCDRVYAPVRGL